MKSVTATMIRDLNNRVLQSTVHYFGPPPRGLTLNIRSIRSVMRKPPTTLLVRGDDGQRTENSGEGALLFANYHDRTDHRDRVEGIGQRHQRRVQEGRDAFGSLRSRGRPRAPAHKYSKAFPRS